MNEIWCAYAEGKQAWKEAGNYYTADELQQLHLDVQKDFESGNFHFDVQHQEILDGN